MSERLLPDFKINPIGRISNEFLKNGIHSFKDASEWVKLLPYSRNPNKEDLITLFSDNCGTCSTKHALLKQLCIENDFQDIELVMGLFKMNGKNTPRISETLRKNNLDYIPEAHNYLKYCGKILDYTKPASDPPDFAYDLIEELVIAPYQISSYKIAYHKNYLKYWLNSNPQIKMTEEELWEVREACIRALSL